MSSILFRCLRSLLLSLAALFLLASAPSAWGQNVPRLAFLAVDRGILTEAGPGQRDLETWGELGSVGRTASTSFAIATGSGMAWASHQSTVTDLVISASLQSGFRGDLGQQVIPFRAETSVSGAFTVTDQVVGSLTGTVELIGTRGGAVLVSIGTNVFEYDEDDLNAGPIEINQMVTFEPGSIYGFAMQADVVDALFDENLNITAAVDVALNLDGAGGGGGPGGGSGTGDSDQDGLPDIWETEGINVDADDDIEIDLPGLGVLPGRQDLIVEVDVQGNSTFPLDVLSDVVDAFSRAPVENPDGSTGITLHLLIDETDLPPLTYPNTGLRGVVADQKQRYFGTQAERADPDWDAIRAAKLRSVRYAVIGGQRANGSSGWGEVLGDDFIVTMENFTRVNPNDYAGTFMHELGHNLGLRHGGGDSVQYKPNYLSVMNYLFQMEKLTSDRIPWALDFSSNQLATLDENGTLEPEGFGPVEPTGGLRFTVYNAGAPNFSPIPQGIEVLADVPVDFNFNGEIDSVRTTLDLNHLIEDLDPSPGELLRGHDDWANLSLAFNTSANFGDGVGGGSGPAGELDPLTLEMLRQVFASLPDLTSNDGDGSEAIPGQYRLDQNYPNPFNPTTTISYDLPRAGNVSLSVYDVLGRQVRELASGTKAAGTYEISFDATGLPSGVYFYRLQAGDYVKTRRMVIVQ